MLAPALGCDGSKGLRVGLEKVEFNTCPGGRNRQRRDRYRPERSSNLPVQVTPAKIPWRGYVHQNSLVPVGSWRRGTILATSSSGESAVVRSKPSPDLVGYAVFSGNNLVAYVKSWHS